MPIADYEAALRVDPKSPRSLHGRGLAKRQQGDARGGEIDSTAVTAIRADVADEFARSEVQP